MDRHHDFGNITSALHETCAGKAGASEELFRLLYDELREMARGHLARLPPGQTLQATALVHEAWLSIAKAGGTWESRRHFFGIAARAMRNVLVDEARRKGSAKRGGGNREVASLEIPSPERDVSPEDILALHEALDDLEAKDQRAAQVVMLRYFAGMSFAEVAGALALSERTVEREWRFGRSWLQERMTRGDDAPRSP